MYYNTQKYYNITDNIINTLYICMDNVKIH